MRKIIAGIVFISLFSSCSMFFDGQYKKDNSKGLNPLALIGGGTLSDDVAQDQSPFLFRHNGKAYIIFSSDRGTPGDMNIWYAEMDVDGYFSEPQSIPTNGINTSMHEYCPSIFSYNSNIYLVFVRDLGVSSSEFQTWLLDDQLTPVSNVCVFTGSQGSMMGLMQDEANPRILISFGVTSVQEYAFNNDNWSNTRMLSFDGIPVAYLSGFNYKGVDYYIGNTVKAFYGCQQLVYGNSSITGVLTPIPFYLSDYDDFSPFVDTETYKVYFASTRYGMGNFDLYRYNYLTYDLLMEASHYVPPTNYAIVYVSTNGSDNNTNTEGTNANYPLLSISLAVAKAAEKGYPFVYVAAGTYVTYAGLDNAASGVLITNISSGMIIMGGWDPTFTYPVGYSELDGGGDLFHIVQISNSVSIMMSGFVLRRGSAGGSGLDGIGGGLLLNCSMGCYFDNMIISNNGAINGGGIAVYESMGSSFNNGGFGLSVIHNTAVSNGGGVYITGSTNIQLCVGSFINTNSAPVGGGGVYIGGNSYYNPISAEISSNFATNGAGVYIASDWQVISMAQIINNGKSYLTGSKGNGIYIDVPSLNAITIEYTVLTNYDIQSGGIVEIAQSGGSPNVVFNANVFGGAFSALTTTGIYIDGTASFGGYRLENNIFITNSLRYIYYNSYMGTNIDSQVFMASTNINNAIVFGALDAMGNMVTNW